MTLLWLILLTLSKLIELVRSWENFLVIDANPDDIDYDSCNTLPLQKELPQDMMANFSQCCPKQCYQDFGSCKGIDGRNYSNVPLCLSTFEEKKKIRRPSCGTDCTIKRKSVTQEDLMIWSKYKLDSYCTTVRFDQLIYDWALELYFCSCNEEKAQEEKVQKEKIDNEAPERESTKQEDKSYLRYRFTLSG